MASDDHWRATYDRWKLATPPEYEGDDPPDRQDPGECQRCDGSGWIVVNQLGRYLGPGPVPDTSTARGLYDEPCDACGNSGVILEEDDNK
jgi:hypothetical protein